MTDFGARYLDESSLRALPFKSVGRNVLIHESCQMVQLENISIGHHVRIDAVTILATGPVNIGSYIHLGTQCFIAGRGGIELQDFCGLSEDVKLYSTNDDYSGKHLTNPTIRPEYLGIRCAKITLERHAIVGSGSVILPGVTIREGCAVGALSLVRHSTEPWSIYAGSPAKKLKDRHRDLLALEQGFLARMQ